MSVRAHTLFGEAQPLPPRPPQPPPPSHFRWGIRRSGGAARHVPETAT